MPSPSDKLSQRECLRICEEHSGNAPVQTDLGEVSVSFEKREHRTWDQYLVSTRFGDDLREEVVYAINATDGRAFPNKFPNVQQWPTFSESLTALDDSN